MISQLSRRRSVEGNTPGGAQGTTTARIDQPHESMPVTAALRSDEEGAGRQAHARVRSGR